MKAVIYARFSPRKNAKECESILTQMSRLRPYCTALGWEIVGEFTDEAKSGASTEGRVGLEQALAAACLHKAVLVVYSLTRLARSTVDAIHIAERLDRCGANLCSLHEHIDTSSPMGRFVYRLFASIGELERENTGERTSDAMQRRQEDGQRMSRYAIYGTRFKGGTAIPEPKEQEVIEQIRKHAAAGLGTQAIAAKLHEDHYRARGGKPWTKCRAMIAKIMSRHGIVKAPKPPKPPEPEERVNAEAIGAGFRLVGKRPKRQK